MLQTGKRRTPFAVVAAGAALALTACGGGSVSEQEQENASQAGAGGGTCDGLDILVHPWVGYTANAYVVGHVAEQELGCPVNYVELKEGGPSYQALASGDGDVILEEWSHEAELESAEADGTAVDLGPMGAVGVIGWYVPGWLAEEHPEVLDWKNLNDFADEFRTSESGGQGQFLGSDPTYTQYDEAIVKNLDLDYKVVFSGGETATVQALEKAQKNKEWLLAYFWEPHYIHAEIPLSRVKLPPYEEGCDAKKAEVACDYAETELKKVASQEFMDSGSPAADLVEKWQWTNEDQNQVAAYITADKMSPEDAAAKWVEDNPDKVEAWLG